MLLCCRPNFPRDLHECVRISFNLCDSLIRFGLTIFVAACYQRDRFVGRDASPSGEVASNVPLKSH